MLRPLRLLITALALSAINAPVLADQSIDIAASVSDVDKAKLIELTRLAAQFEHAEGVPRDYPHALELYCVAAKAGYAEAQYAMGWMYVNGRGVPRNDAIAQQLFQIAAEQGHPQAKQMLGTIVVTEMTSLPPCFDVVVEVPGVKNAETFIPVYPKGKVAQLVQKLAPRYSIDANFALAIIYVESGFNEKALSQKNAQGLMQLTPDTAQRFSVKNAFDAEDNIKGGLSYLRWLLAYFRGNVSLVAAAYNAGEGAVEKYHGVPPYLETHDYVQKINRLYQKTTHPYQRNLVTSSPIVMHRASKNQL